MQKPTEGELSEILRQLLMRRRLEIDSASRAAGSHIRRSVGQHTHDSSYTDMVTVTKTSDNDTTQSYALPGSLSGTVYVRVLDFDQTAGQKTLDTVYVDEMWIESAP